MAAKGGSSKPPRNARPSTTRFSLLPPNRLSFSSRRSSVICGKGAQPRQDTRPINDKAFQAASMRRLVEYLTNHGYSFPISPKSLPSGKDIHNMIEFLFCQVEPNYRLAKLEDDVPLFFRTLGYPSQISKSALYAAGSPHSWPNLLAALSWLVDLLNCCEIDESVEAESRAEFESIHEYLMQGYSCFLQGDDEGWESLDGEMKFQLNKDTEEARKNAEQIAQQITELESKLQALQSEPSPLVNLETKKSMLLSDAGKFNTLIQNLISHKSNLEKKLEQHKQRLESRKTELARITAENQSLAQRVATQTVNVEDIDKMSRELQRVSDDLQEVSSARKQKEKETWDLEVLASKLLKKLEDVTHELNHAMKRLKLLNISGNPFEIHLNPRGETALDMIGINIKQTIMPQMVALVDGMEKNVREKWKESTDLLKEIGSKEDVLQEKQATNLRLEEKMKELEGVIKKQREKLDSIHSAIQRIRIEIEESEERLKALELESSEKHETAEKELEQTQASCENEIQQEAAKLFTVFEAVAGFLERAHAKNSFLVSELGQLKDMVDNNYIRRLKQSQQSSASPGETH